MSGCRGHDMAAPMYPHTELASGGGGKDVVYIASCPWTARASKYVQWCQFVWSRLCVGMLHTRWQGHPHIIHRPLDEISFQTPAEAAASKHN